jgi:hypothetical protein
MVCEDDALAPLPISQDVCPGGDFQDHPGHIIFESVDLLCQPTHLERFAPPQQLGKSLDRDEEEHEENWLAMICSSSDLAV